MFRNVGKQLPTYSLLHPWRAKIWNHTSPVRTANFVPLRHVINPRLWTSVPCHADGAHSQQLNTARYYVPIDTASQSRIRKQSSPRGRETHTWPSYACILHCCRSRWRKRALSVTPLPLAHISLSIYSTTRAQDQYQHRPTNKHIPNNAQYNSKHSIWGDILGCDVVQFFQMPTFRSSHHRILQF